MRYVELDERGRVRFVLPQEMSGQYSVLPPNGIEIPDETEVALGMLYVDGAFRYSTPEEIQTEHRPAFDAERARRFRDTEWIRQRHADRAALGIDDAANWTAWLNYWQSLRDMPEAAGFDTVNPA